ncbi:trypsin-like peptidase domain-containing protein [Streptomyces sp. NPDC005752]|uniref:trypsin-like peptidase domain-containing protein n=1 Tax=Streptomyces sp. NPDC005752 TaxID=3157065 RepID=UPI0033C920E4
MPGLDAERVVSVSVGDGRRGSGYLLTPDLVLTAGHCVKRGAQVKVRRYAREPGDDKYVLQRACVFEVAACGDARDLDYALLTCGDHDPFELRNRGRSSPVRLGRLVGDKPVPAQALGFPRAQRDDEGGLNVEDARGTVSPRSGSVSGSRAGSRSAERWNFQIDSGTSLPQPGGSLWSGMSGAALFSGGHLVGVIVEDRGAVMGRLTAVPVARIFDRAARPEAVSCLRRTAGREAAAALLAVNPVWAGGGMLKPAYSPLPPAAQWSETDLLDACYNVVPFQGRKQVVRELTEWCEGPERIRVRLLSGPAAVGKTRLARELCLRMGARGWIAGLVDPLWTAFSEVGDLDENRILVVDDADAHAGHLESLVANAVSSQCRHPLRILAVAHGAGGGPWWQSLKRRYEALVDENDPPCLGPPVLADRQDVYQAAYQAFRSWYEQDKPVSLARMRASAPATEVLPDLESDDFDSYLLILIQALVDARACSIKESRSVVTTAQFRRDALLDYAIDVDRRRWQESARAAHLPDDPVLLERIVAVASLAVATGRTEGSRETEGVGETEAARRLLLVPDLAGESEWRRRAFARWQHGQFAGDGYLRPLQPQRLAERLGARVIEMFPQLASQLLDVSGTGPGIPSNSPDRCRQVLNVLDVLQITAATDGHAAGREPEEGDDDLAGVGGAGDTAQQKARGIVLERVLREYAVPIIRLVKEMAVTDHRDSAGALGASLAAALNTSLRETSAQEVSAEVLTELDEYPPDALLELAVATATHAVAYYRCGTTPTTTANRSGLATALRHLSLYLANSGHRSQACENAWEAVDTYRALEQAAPGSAWQLELAQMLSELGDRLDDVGRYEEAHDHAREAVRIFEQLRRSESPGFDSSLLARALCAQASAASGIDRKREALQATTEACELTRQLPRDPNIPGAELDRITGEEAFTLRALSLQLIDMRRGDEAVEKAELACARYKGLLARNRGRWERDYALALSILGSAYAATRQWDESIGSHAAAVNDHYVLLERRYREAVRPEHALALHRLASAHLARAGCPAEASDDCTEALRRCRQALDQYDVMHSEDRWATRFDRAATHRLYAEINLRMGAVKSRAHEAEAPQLYEQARKAARNALSLYEEMDTRTFRSRSDRAQVRKILADALSGQGGHRTEALAEYGRAKQEFSRLDAEEPGQVDAFLREVEDMADVVVPSRARSKYLGKKRRRRHGRAHH